MGEADNGCFFMGCGSILLAVAYGIYWLITTYS